MKSNHTSEKGSPKLRFNVSLIIKSVLFSMLLISTFQTPVNAQTTDQYNHPSWWFGAAAGANFNFYRGSTQQLNASFTPPSAFHDGFGVGLFLAPTIEYYKPNSMFGFMLQFGYDGRNGEYDEILTPCNCPTELSTNLSYVTIEPSLRFAPGRSNFYLFAGPRFAFNLNHDFVYQQRINPAFPDQIEPEPVEGEFSHMNETQLSMQIGMGYDIPLSTAGNRTQFVLSPFVSFHPYFGQSPRSIETWNISTVRAGAALKLGVGSKKVVDEAIVVVPIYTEDAKAEFSVESPENIPVKRTVRESFPVLNYVFFDLGSTEIPKRYVLLKKDQVKDFKEEQVELFTPENLTGRSKRQMVVYYNVLNILGDRMVKNPTSTIRLIGSSELGVEDGTKMANSVKTYLVDVFGIDAGRIAVSGNDKPKIPSEKPGATEDLDLLRAGDRRVSIESNSPALLVEYQSGPTTPLKPLEIVDVSEAPVESYVKFNNPGATKAYSSWMLSLKDEKGVEQLFGPYTQDFVAIPGKTILGTRTEGDYKVKMIGTTMSGKKVEKDSKVHLVLWTPPVTDVVMRYSITFDFDESVSPAKYEKYLTEVVAPRIPKGAKVIVHGHTDIIGDAAYNQTLSTARANEVKNIIQSALIKAGRNDVRFEVLGLGEDPLNA
jgi:outer membrane protein OmpA-like peptidoglycan-associated protein